MCVGIEYIVNFHMKLKRTWNVLISGVQFATLMFLSSCGPAAKYYPATAVPGAVDFDEKQVLLIENPRHGTAVSGITEPPYPLTGIELDKFNSTNFEWLVKSGAYWLRYNGLLWSEVEPQEGARNWSALSELEGNLVKAAQLNQKVILVVRSTPEWAQAVPGHFCGPIDPSRMDAFGDFMYELVKRYSQPPYSVKFWEIYNEPDIAPELVSGDNPYGCWGDADDEFYGGGRYAEMLHTIYPRIKAADPQAQVLVGGLLLDCDPVHPPENRDCRPSNFIEGILRAGGGDSFDGISFHAYDYYSQPFGYSNQNWHSSHKTSGPVNAVKARHLNSLLLKYELTGKYLINTEAGLLCGRSGDEPMCQTYEFNMAKAFYVALSNAAALQEGFLGNIWFNLTGWRGTGLIDANGNALPAMSAMRYSSIQLNGASFIRTIQEIPGLSGIEYFRDGKFIWLLWSQRGAGQRVRFEDQGVMIYDVWGNSMPGSPYLTVTSAPVYIEWHDPGS